MTTTKLNNVINGVLTVAAILTAIPSDSLNIVPTRWKEYVEAVIAMAFWIKSHRNLFINPDGTPAWQRWLPVVPAAPPGETPGIEQP